MFGIKELDASEAQQLLAEQEDEVVLVDVRSPAEVAQAAIPGAIHIPLNLLPMQFKELPANKKIIFYCRSGIRSAQACAFVSSYGLDNTYNLRGGIIAWLQSGLAVA